MKQTGRVQIAEGERQEKLASPFAAITTGLRSLTPNFGRAVGTVLKNEATDTVLGNNPILGAVSKTKASAVSDKLNTAKNVVARSYKRHRVSSAARDYTRALEGRSPGTLTGLGRFGPGNFLVAGSREAHRLGRSAELVRQVNPTRRSGNRVADVAARLAARRVNTGQTQLKPLNTNLSRNISRTRDLAASGASAALFPQDAAYSGIKNLAQRYTRKLNPETIAARKRAIREKGLAKTRAWERANPDVVFRDGRKISREVYEANQAAKVAKAARRARVMAPQPMK